MRVILDINILLSGLFWRGSPHALLNYVRDGTLTLISSPALLAELAGVIERSKFDAILKQSNTSRELHSLRYRHSQKLSRLNHCPYQFAVMPMMTLFSPAPWPRERTSSFLAMPICLPYEYTAGSALSMPLQQFI